MVAVIIARTMDGLLPNRPMLPLGETTLIERIVKLAKDAGLGDALVGSDSAVVGARLGDSARSYVFGGALALGGGTEFDAVAEVLARRRLELQSDLDDAEPVAVLDVGAGLLRVDDLQQAMSQMAKHPWLLGVVSVSKDLPIYLTNFRKGSRVAWHVQKTKTSRKGIFMNGCFKIVRYGILRDTCKLITGRSGIQLIPKERSLVVSDAWDYLAAKSWKEGNLNG